MPYDLRGRRIHINTWFMKLKWIVLTPLAVSLSRFAGARIAAPPNTGADEAQKADLYGGVFNSETKRGLNNVTITATHLASRKEKVVQTNDDGDYTFTDLEAGTYKFVFVRSGYKKVVKDKIYIRENEAFQIDVALQPHNQYDFLPGPFFSGEEE